MPYLFSLLSPSIPTIESTQVLCYYVNTSSDIQNIRAVDRANCHLERVVFPKERILFLAHSASFLEVSSSTVNGTAFKEIDCKSLAVADKSTLNRDLSANQQRVFS